MSQFQSCACSHYELFQHRFSQIRLLTLSYTEWTDENEFWRVYTGCPIYNVITGTLEIVRDIKQRIKTIYL